MSGNKDFVGTLRIFVTVQPCDKKIRNTVWEIAHETVFRIFLTYGALPKRGNDAKQRFRASWLNCYEFL